MVTRTLSSLCCKMSFKITGEQLRDGRGNIINQAIQLKDLGLKSDKKISTNLLPSSFDDAMEEDSH